MEQREPGGIQRIVPGEGGGAPDVAGEHRRPLHIPERTAGCGDGRLEVSLPQTDAQLSREHLHHGARRTRIAAREQLPQQRRLGGGPAPRRRRALWTSATRRLPVGTWPAEAERLGHCCADVRGAIVCRAKVRAL